MKKPVCSWPVWIIGEATAKLVTITSMIFEEEGISSDFCASQIEATRTCGFSDLVLGDGSTRSCFWFSSHLVAEGHV